MEEMILSPAEEELACYEAVIEKAIRSSVEMAIAFSAIRSKRLFTRARGYKTFEDYCRDRWEIVASRARQLIAAADVISNLKSVTRVTLLPATEYHIRPLVALSKDDQIECWSVALNIVGNDPKRITASVVEQAVKEYKSVQSEKQSDALANAPQPEITADELPNGNESPAPVQQPTEEHPIEATTTPAEPETETLVLEIQETAPTVVKVSPFNRTNDNVEWALWTWNPVTGCLHDCPYCYARDIANRHYPQKFVPTFHENRIAAPRHMKVPAAAATNMGEKNVFVCSMADLWGKWVPREWIEAILAEVRNAPDWNFLFLTKFPMRYEEFAGEIPANAWIGTTVDRQHAVARAEKAFARVQEAGHQGIRWLSCEPMLERLTFERLDMFDWVVVGGASRSTQTPEFKPPLEWTFHLWQQAKAHSAAFYMKTNLYDQTSRERQYPWEARE